MAEQKKEKKKVNFYEEILQRRHSEYADSINYSETINWVCKY